MTQDIPLNAGQDQAAKGFFDFLFQDDKSELIISGPGGVGKTFLMGHLIDKIIPQYHEACKLMGLTPEFDQVVMTATTNKAAEVLGEFTGRPSQTIHSFLNLTVRDDYSTGRSNLTKTPNWIVHHNSIIFIDEGYMVDTPLLRYIREGTHKCKIVFVGDHCQLGPVMERISPIHNEGLPFYELTEPMRNSNQPALMNICNQLRHTVETGQFFPIEVIPGVIDWVDDNGMGDAIELQFKDTNPHARILAYTNAQVVKYNDYVREVRQFVKPYTVGEVLINNNAVRLKSDMLRVEEEMEVMKVSDVIQSVDLPDGASFDVVIADLQSKVGGLHTEVKLPADKDHFNSLLTYYKNRKEWKKFFDLKNYYPDLRPRDAATVHKAQGSSYTTVYIDMANISTCRNPEAAARMLYVAFTRARERIVMYGNLADKFGGITY